MFNFHLKFFAKNIFTSTSKVLNTLTVFQRRNKTQQDLTIFNRQINYRSRLEISKLTQNILKIAKTEIKKKLKFYSLFKQDNKKSEGNNLSLK